MKDWWITTNGIDSFSVCACMCVWLHFRSSMEGRERNISNAPRKQQQQLPSDRQLLVTSVVKFTETLYLRLCCLLYSDKRSILFSQSSCRFQSLLKFSFLINGSIWCERFVTSPSGFYRLKYLHKALSLASTIPIPSDSSLLLIRGDT